MKYFKKRIVFFVIAIALTLIDVCVAENFNSSYNRNFSNSRNISEDVDINVSRDMESQVYGAGFNTEVQSQKSSVEDEFASLHVDVEQNEVIDDTLDEVVYESKALDDDNSVQNLNDNVEFKQPSSTYGTENNSYETLLLILSAILIVVCIIFFLFRAKNNLAEIVGERLEIDVEDDNSKNDKKDDKSKKIKKIKETVKTLDRTYSKTAVRGTYNLNEKIKSENVSIPMKEPQKIEEKPEVVDLDKLLDKKNKKSSLDIEAENKALEEFLSGFSFYEEDEFFEEDEFKYDENLYQETIKNNKLVFRKQDLEKINKLLLLEISDETFNNIDNYLVSNPIVINPKEKILESLISDYAINKNITFTEEDFFAIQKIMNVELDRDFVTDLRYDPELTKRMQKELEDFTKENKKPEKIKTLNVKEMLPDLSEALIKHGGRRIESNYRPDTIYFQSGYDVSVLSVSEMLSNESEIALQTEIQNDAQVEYNLLDEKYDVAILDTKNSLPNLSIAINEPINEVKQVVESQVPDEKKLLKNLNNVKFRNIDEKRNIEILNSDIVEKDKKNIQNKIMNKIAEAKTKQEIIENKTLENEIKKITESKKLAKEEANCVVENKAYVIKQSVVLKDNIGCYLAKNDLEYCILSYVGDNISKIRDYDSLKIEKIQARLAETLEDGTLRFIVRVGLNKKILLDVNGDSVKYVMDL